MPPLVTPAQAGVHLASFRRGRAGRRWISACAGMTIVAMTLNACDASASRRESANRVGAPAELPRLTGRVVDRANMLGPTAEAALSAKLADLEHRRTDQLVVVTIPSLGGRTIEEVGLKLGRGWGIGQKHKNNGVLLIVAPRERQVRIEVGYGLEQSIQDHEAARMIQDTILPAFRTGTLERGVLAGADAIIAELDRSPLVAVKP